MAKMTPQERRAEQAEKLAEAVQALSTDEGYQNFLRARRRLHKYSMNNWMLIYSQCPEATFVQGFGNKAGTSGWKAVGRHVVKGEKAIKILAPMTGKVMGDDGIERTKVFGFKFVNVFDVSQTEGEPFGLPEVEHTWDGDDPETLWDALVMIAAERNYRVDLGSSAQGKGWMNPRTGEILVDHELSMAERIGTLVHELCHAFDSELSIEAYQVHRADFEVVAESAAFMILDGLGFEATAPSAGYVTGWCGGDPSKVRDLLTRITGIADRIEARLFAGADVDQAVAA